MPVYPPEADNVAKLTSLGVPFVVPQQFIDTDKENPMGRFFINIMGNWSATS